MSPIKAKQKYLVIDYETYSEVDLKKVGAAEYAVSPTTEILCVAWALGTMSDFRNKKYKVRSWAPTIPSSTKDLFTSLLDPSVIIVAHNAGFEQWITRFVLARLFPSKPELGRLPHERFMCTATMAAALALPRSLEGACAALKLPVQKDMDGRRLVLKWCKPRKPTKNNLSTRQSDPEEFKRLMQYCENDIHAEIALFTAVPKLNKNERKIWLLDQKMNFRGFNVDRRLVIKTLSMIATEEKALLAETKEITNGEVRSTKQVKKTLAWLTAEGVRLDNLTAKSVADALNPLPELQVEGRARRLLEIRRDASRSSTKKYEALELRSRFDGRIRDSMLYWGASTARWTGKGVQPHNFPRGTIKNSTLACDVMLDGDLEMVRLIYGNPMEVFSSCLRGAITAPRGKLLFVSDFASIETRVLFWLANNRHGLDLFRSGEDLYKVMAASIYNKQVKDVTAVERQLGKKAILGLGYQMGDKKFYKSCTDESISITHNLAKRAVVAYRDEHSDVVRLWSRIQRIAMTAIQNPGRKFKTNNTMWWVENKFLWCELPSGRRLAYYRPTIRQVLTQWREKRPAIFHWGIDTKTKQWVNQATYGGKLVENIVQAVARDFLAEAMLRIEDKGYEVILSVHDEVIAERRVEQGSLDDFNGLMSEVPAWGEGCPIKVEGFSAVRYRK